jgi:hypothetical protein
MSKINLRLSGGYRISIALLGGLILAGILFCNYVSRISSAAEYSVREYAYYYSDNTYTQIVGSSVEDGCTGAVKVHGQVTEFETNWAQGVVCGHPPQEPNPPPFPEPPPPTPTPAPSGTPPCCL